MLVPHARPADFISLASLKWYALALRAAEIRAGLRAYPLALPPHYYGEVMIGDKVIGKLTTPFKLTSVCGAIGQSAQMSTDLGGGRVELGSFSYTLKVDEQGRIEAFYEIMQKEANDGETK